MISSLIRTCVFSAMLKRISFNSFLTYDSDLLEVGKRYVRITGKYGTTKTTAVINDAEIASYFYELDSFVIIGYGIIYNAYGDYFNTSNIMIKRSDILEVIT
jgi:hypothetical protein